MSESLPKPAVYVVDGCVIDLQDVSTVICAVFDGIVKCLVILRSGTSFNVDMQYSRSLIQAVEWNRAPGSVVKPKDGIVPQGEIVGNSWN